MRISMKTTIALMGALSLSVACPGPTGDDGGTPEEDGGVEEDGGSEPECTIDDDCGTDEVCVDEVCEDVCLDSVCLPDGQLCQYDTADAAYNQCVDAEAITADCDEAAEAEAVAGTDAIVIYGAETIAEVPDGCSVGADSFTLRGYYFDVFSEEDLTGVTAQDVVFRPGFAAGNEKFFEDTSAADPADDIVTELAQLDDNGTPIEDEYYVIAWICGSPNSAAIQIDTTTNVSNAFCFDPLAAAE